MKNKASNVMTSLRFIHLVKTDFIHDYCPLHKIA